MNTLIVFTRGLSVGYFIFYILPFAVIMIILLVIRKAQSKINTHLMLFLGLIVTLVGNAGNFSGAIFIVYAIHLDPGRNKTIAKLGLLAIAITCKSLIMDIHTIQIVSLLFINMLCYGYYYVLFTEKKIITITEIEDQTEQIMQYVIDGKRNKEIAAMTFMSEAAVQKRIKRLMIKENCETLPQLVFKLYGNRQQGKKIDRFKVI
jgi:DNA-binding CsgD family transcriptional regulator